MSEMKFTFTADGKEVEESLDRIGKKIKSVQSNSSLGGFASGLGRSIAGLNKAAVKLSFAAQKLSQAASGASSASVGLGDSLTEGMGDLGGGISGIGGGGGATIAAFSKGAKVLTTAIAAAIAGIGAVVYGAKTAIEEAANRETLETAFIPLLGSVEEAEKRIAELSKFAAETPFELNEISAASRTLQTLTDGAMATGENLRLVGDIASGTNKPFEEIAVSVGRLYAGLDSGRPVGEALQSLSQIGAISPNVRTQLEALQKAGKKGSEVWKVAAQDLERYSGSMKLQSKTWNGLMSTMRGGLQDVQANFGKGLMEALKPALEAGIAGFNNMAEVAKQVGDALGNAIAVAIQLIQDGSAWDVFKTAGELALKEYANLWWKTFNGVISGLAQAAISLLDIIAEGLNDIIDFNRLKQIVSLAASFYGNLVQSIVFKTLEYASKAVAYLIDKIAPLLDKLGFSAPKRFAEGIREGGEMYGSKARAAWNDTKTSFGNYYDGVLKGKLDKLIEEGGKIGKAVTDGFKSTEDIFDTAELSKSLGNSIKEAQEKVNIKREQTRAEQNEIAKNARSMPQESYETPQESKGSDIGRVFKMVYDSLSKTATSIGRAGNGYGALYSPLTGANAITSQMYKVAANGQTTNQKLDTIIECVRNRRPSGAYLV